MERPSTAERASLPPSSPLFQQAWGALHSALNDATRIAMHLKEAHEVQMKQEMEDLAQQNGSLVEINKRLCREIEELRNSVPPKPILPHQMPHGIEIGDEPETRSQSRQSRQSQTIEDQSQEPHDDPTPPKLETPKSPRPTDEDGLRESARGLEDGLRESASAKSLADDEPRIRFTRLESRESESDLPLRSFSQASILIMREIWLEAKKELVKEAQDRLSFVIAKKNHKSRLQRGTSLALKLQAERVHKQERCGIMHPIGKCRLIWNGLCALAIVYDCFWIPMNVFDLDHLVVLRVCEWFLTFLWTADVFMTFRTGYFVGPVVEMRQKQIAVHYAKTWLFIDVLIVVLEWLGRLLNITSSASLFRSTRAARNITSFVKLVRLAKMQAIWGIVQEQVNSNIFELSWKIILLCIAMIACIHVFSCLWYAMGSGADDGWITYDEYTGEKNTVFWYIASARWVISQLNGRTDMNPRRNMLERLFTCVMGIILALIAQALFISIITKTMIDLSEVMSEKTRRRRIVNDYLELHPLTPALNSHVKRCLFEYKDSVSYKQKEDVVLGLLPNFLQTDVLYEVRAPVVTKHSFYHSLRLESPGSIRFLCKTVFHLVPASKCEVLFDKGDVCTRMLFTDRLVVTYGDPYEKATDTRDVAFAFKNQLKSKVSLKSPKSLGRAKTSADSPDSSLPTTSRNFNPELSCGPNSQDLATGEWLCEAALWTNWKNQGRLVINDHGVLLGIHANELASALSKFPFAFAMASMYAEKFVEHLRKQDMLSDVITFEIVTIAPIHLHINLIGASGLESSTFERHSSLASGSNFFKSGSKHFGYGPKVYCICKTTGATGPDETCFTTEAVNDGSDPMWYHSQNINISRHQSLVFEIWNDDLIGEARLGPQEFLPNGFAGDRFLVGAGMDSAYITINVQVLKGTPMESPMAKASRR